MLSYQEFKHIPIVRHVLGAMDVQFEGELLDANSYKAFRRNIVALNDGAERRGCFVKSARHYAGVCSSGERLALVGLMILLDFTAQADEIAKARTGSAGSMTFLFGGGDDDTRAALGACVENACY